MKRIAKTIENWENWISELYLAIAKFEEIYGMLPSYVVANENTFMQIDFLTNFSNARNMVKSFGDDEKKSSDVHLTHIQYKNSVINFVEDALMKSNTFSVEHDSCFDYNMSLVAQQKVLAKSSFYKVA